MKVTTTLCVLFLFIAVSYSQEIDERLLASYSVEELNEMIANSPDEYALLDYALDNAVYFSAGPNPKAASLPVISLPADGANFVDLGLKIENLNQYFKISGVDKILVVKSRVVLTHEMQKK